MTPGGRFFTVRTGDNAACRKPGRACHAPRYNDFVFNIHQPTSLITRAFSKTRSTPSAVRCRHGEILQTLDNATTKTVVDSRSSFLLRP
jgi:hypothetical protein